MSEEEPPARQELQVAPDLSQWVRRMEGFLNQVESKIQTYQIGQVPEPMMSQLRQLRSEAEMVRHELPDVRQIRRWSQPPVSTGHPPWVVKVDLELVRERMSKADGVRHSAEEVRAFLHRAGFVPLDGFYLVNEGQLGHVEPDEVTHLLSEEGQLEPAIMRAAEDRLDWQENQGHEAQVSARWALIAISITALATAALTTALWFLARHGH